MLKILRKLQKERPNTGICSGTSIGPEKSCINSVWCQGGSLPESSHSHASRQVQSEVSDKPQVRGAHQAGGLPQGGPVCYRPPLAERVQGGRIRYLVRT